MPTYERCDSSVKDMARELRAQFPEHEPLDLAGVRIDYVFASGDRDEANQLLTDAITHQGRKALGLASIRNIKARALMPYDGEILLDLDHWAVCGEAQRRALLDHELMHFALKLDETGSVKTDDLNRPKLQMRKHDVEFGWFASVAARHGAQSIERIQAKTIVDEFGQYFWLGIVEGPRGLEAAAGAGAFISQMAEGLGEGGSVTITAGDKKVTIPGRKKAAASA